MYRHILYPTDGSTGSEAAMAHVRELATEFDATVHVLHVVDTRHVGLGMSGGYLSGSGSGLSGTEIEGEESGMVGKRIDPDEQEETFVDRARPFVEETAAEFDDVDTVPAVKSGNPHEVILEYVDDHDIDLVVMGTHGRTGVERYLLGSVSEKVVRMADPPVMTVSARDDE
jgi:nucleotide-binding universal stress UspA family protein